MNLDGKRILISRTDSIGDVMLSLPMCAWLKNKFPSSTVLFLGRKYTESIVNAYDRVDQFVDWDSFSPLSKEEKTEKLTALKVDVIVHVFPNKEIASIAKKAKIPFRIGTSHRVFHLLTCTHRLNFTRKNSEMHESQLNHELLRPFGITELPALEEIIETTQFFDIPEIDLPHDLSELNNVTILHPKSQGSAKEWPIEKYMETALFIANKGEKVVFTGTETEGEKFRKRIPDHPNIFDSTGTLSLEQLMLLIAKSTNLVACSTGPLHIAGYYGVNTIGLYSPKKPIHPGRWKALGKQVKIIVFNKRCVNCEKGADCDCILSISVDAVLDKLV